MRNLRKQVALFLALMTVLSLSVNAASVSDSKTAAFVSGARNEYLKTTSGNTIGGSSYTYTTNDGISGGGYCINWGLKATTKSLPIAGRYTSSPQTMGAFANGYPQRPLAEFLDINLADNTELAGLTEDEYAYATQVAVWATLGQLSVEGTGFSSGRAALAKPSGNAQQTRVFRALEIILYNAGFWTKPLFTGMYIRVEDDRLGNSAYISLSLQEAADNGGYGIKKETIGGKEYYTRRFIAASATSTYPNDYKINLWTKNAPSGSILTDMSNAVLPQVKGAYQLHTVSRETSLNANGIEYYGEFKLCVPAEKIPDTGEIEITMGADVAQYNIYLANNTESAEQSYIIADPGKTTVYADGILKWDSEASDGSGSVVVTKADGTGNPLAGAVFSLEASDGSCKSGTSDSKGKVSWNGLNPSLTYTLRETRAPPGYSIVKPVKVIVLSNQTSHVTVRNDPEPQLYLRKIDAQNGYPLRGATFVFEKIDGSFGTTAVTGHDGMLQLDSKTLPFGSYRVTEKQSPEGYVLDTAPQTVHWDGAADVILTFKNVRQSGFTIIKTDADTGVSLSGAVFRIYKDGKVITDVTVNDNGAAYVNGLSEGYYEVEEITAPKGYALDGKRHGIHIDPYNPATEDDPVLIITNKYKPTLTIKKIDSVTGSPVKGALFQVWQAVNDSLSGELIDLGRYYSDEKGEIVLENQATGWVRIQELEPAAGYGLKDPFIQDVFLESGKDKTVIFENTPLSSLIIRKLDSDTGLPVQGAAFRIRYLGGTSGSGGTVIHDGVTGTNGTIILTGLKAGTYVAEEYRPANGYELSNPATQTAYISGDAQAAVELVFHNARKGGLVIKKLDSVTSLPLAGVTFKVTDSSGGVIGPDNGEYITDADGLINIAETLPIGSTVIIQEIACPDTHVLDKTAQSVKIKENTVHTLTFYNTPKGGLQILKLDEETRRPIPGVEFRVARMNGEIIGVFRTDAGGIIHLPDADSGWYCVTETKSAKGYISDDTVYTVEVKAGVASVLTVTNRKTSGIIIHKVDSETGKGIPGVLFLLFDENNNPMGQYESDQEGYVYIGSGLPDGKYKIREVQAAAGYILDEQVRTIYLEYGRTTEIEWKNNPARGQIVITKRSAYFNEVTNLPAGSPLSGAVFEVYTVTGNMADRMVSGANGIAASKPLSPGVYIVKEVSPPNYYALNIREFIVEIRHSGDIVKLEILNGNASLGVNIRKKSQAQINQGQMIIWDLYDIANSSTVALESFYVHDRLPTDAVLGAKVFTGTWSHRLSYRVTYKTNYSAEYMVLASGLNTKTDYELSIHPNVLGLRPGEYVTDIRWEFGTVPAGFKCEVAPRLQAQVRSSLPKGYKIVNRADAGGKYINEWETSQASWTTIVYGNPNPAPELPKSGY